MRFPSPMVRGFVPPVRPEECNELLAMSGPYLPAKGSGRRKINLIRGHCRRRGFSAGPASVDAAPIREDTSAGVPGVLLRSAVREFAAPRANRREAPTQSRKPVD